MWSLCDPKLVADQTAQGMTNTEILAVAWRLLEKVKDPEDFRQLDQFLGMASDHCDNVRLSAALEEAEAPLRVGVVDLARGPDTQAYAEYLVDSGFFDVRPEDYTDPPGRWEVEIQAATTHEQNTPVPGPGPRGMRAALARASQALWRSNDSWAGDIVGALSLGLLTIVLIIAAGVLS